MAVRVDLGSRSVRGQGSQTGQASRVVAQHAMAQYRKSIHHKIEARIPCCEMILRPLFEKTGQVCFVLGVESQRGSRELIGAL